MTQHKTPAEEAHSRLTGDAAKTKVAESTPDDAEESSSFAAAEASMSQSIGDANDIIKTFEARLHESFKTPAKGLPKLPSAAIDPAIISMILQAVMEMLKMCFQPKPEIAKAMKSPGMFATYQVRSTVRDRLRDEHGLGAYRIYGGDALTDHCLTVAKSASDSERLALVNAAKQLAA